MRLGDNRVLTHSLKKEVCGTVGGSTGKNMTLREDVKDLEVTKTLAV